MGQLAGEISYDILKEMKYLEACVIETLRKWPILNGPLERKCEKEFYVKDAFGRGRDYLIPRGVSVQIFPLGVQMDERYYPDPENFDPERFLSDGKVVIDPTIYFAFGGGPRYCVGSRFSMLGIKMAVFSIMQHFQVVPVPRSTIPIELAKTFFSMKIKNGFCVGLKQKSVG